MQSVLSLYCTSNQHAPAHALNTSSSRLHMHALCAIALRGSGLIRLKYVVCKVFNMLRHADKSVSPIW